jgi:hypothetical protein
MTDASGGALRVAVRSAEAPEPLLADADLVVEGPPRLRGFLERLATSTGSSRSVKGVP